MKESKQGPSTKRGRKPASGSHRKARRQTGGQSSTRTAKSTGKPMHSGAALQGESPAPSAGRVVQRVNNLDGAADLFARLAREPRACFRMSDVQACLDQLLPSHPSCALVMAAIRRRHDDGLSCVAGVIGSIITGDQPNLGGLGFLDIERVILVGRSLAVTDPPTRVAVRVIQVALVELGRRLEANVLLGPSSLLDLESAPRTAEAIARVLDNGPVPAIRGMLRSLCLALHLPEMSATAERLIPVALPATNSPATWRRRLADTPLLSDTLDRLLQGDGRLPTAVRCAGAVSLARDLLERGEQRRVVQCIRDARESVRAGHLASQTAAALAGLIELTPSQPSRSMAGRRLGPRVVSR